MSPCDVCTTSEAVIVLRIQPRCDVPPISDEVRRAVCWPGQAAPCDVAVCSAHSPTVKDAAVAVLSARSLGEDVEYRVLTDEEVVTP